MLTKIINIQSSSEKEAGITITEKPEFVFNGEFIGFFPFFTNESSYK